VALSVAGIIEPALQAAEAARAAAGPTNDLTAYDLYLRAYALELSSAPKALRLLDQAIGIRITDRRSPWPQSSTRHAGLLVGAKIWRLRRARAPVLPGEPCRWREAIL
jgi:hypothetical protein